MLTPQMPKLKLQTKPVKPKERQVNPVITAHQQLERAEKLRKAGKLDEALKVCEALIDKHPDYVGALHTLGLIQIDRKSYWQSLSCFVRAAMLNPQDWTILTNLANVYLGLGAEVMAAHTLEQALALNSEDANVHFVLGQIYESQREYVLAVECFRKALSLDPKHAGALHISGRCYGHLGENENAAEVLVKSLEASSEPENMIHTLYSLGQLPASVVEIDVLERLKDVECAIPDPDDKTRARFAFIRASAYHKRGRHDEAWAQVVEANGLLAGNYRDLCGRYFARHDNSLKYAEKAKWKPVSEKGTAGKTPYSLFILGPSRSGKTTLEYLISRLDGVKRGYESGVVDTATRRTSQLSGLLTLADPWQLPPTLGDRFGTIYRDELESRLEGGRVFTNTHPGRIDDVGALVQAIPNCRFVFVKRNPQDIAIRIFMKHYKEGTNPYAYDIRNIFGQINWYHRMIDVWTQKLPKHCMVVDYEQMIENPGEILDSVARFCDLPLPSGDSPKLGDDRGCAAPYLDMIAAARRA